MPPRKRATGSSSQPDHGQPSRGRRNQPPPEPQFDNTRFRNFRCSEDYKTIVGKTIILERGIDVSEAVIIKEEIENRGWDEFVATPADAVLPVVHEFYANGIMEDEDGESCGWVRGCLIRLALPEVSAASGFAPWPEEDMYLHAEDFWVQNRLDPDWMEVYTTICREDAECLRPGEPLPPTSLKRAALRPVAKFWNLFVTTRLLPSKNENVIDKDRAFLIYCLVAGHRFDPAMVIRRSLLLSMRDSQSLRRALPFPSLITRLARTVGVRISDAETKTTPVRPLGDSSIDGLIPGTERHPPMPTRGAGPSHPPPPQPSQPPMVESDIAQMLQTMSLNQNRAFGHMMTNQTRAYEHMIQLQELMIRGLLPGAVIPPMPHFEMFDFGGVGGFYRGPGEGGSRAPSGTEVVGDDDPMPAEGDEATDPIDED